MLRTKLDLGIVIIHGLEVSRGPRAAAAAAAAAAAPDVLMGHWWRVNSGWACGLNPLTHSRAIPVNSLAGQTR